MIEKVRQALEGILARFEAGDIPEAAVCSTFPIPKILAAKWSLFNRALMLIAGFPMVFSMLSIFGRNVALLYKNVKTTFQEVIIEPSF